MQRFLSRVLSLHMVLKSQNSAVITASSLIPHLRGVIGGGSEVRKMAGTATPWYGLFDKAVRLFQ